LPLAGLEGKNSMQGKYLCKHWCEHHKEWVSGKKKHRRRCFKKNNGEMCEKLIRHDYVIGNRATYIVGIMSEKKRQEIIY
jgi:hypothetical protein